MDFEREGVNSREEEEFCRICRAGVEEGVLYRPCRCLGSIRSVHEGCLVEWLEKSKRQKCELCDTPLMFTKVYAKSMPDHLPLLLLLKRSMQSFASVILLGLRGIAVASCWLVILPYTTLWIMRGLLFTDSSLHNIASIVAGNKTESYLVYGNELLQVLANATVELSTELKSQLLTRVTQPGNWTMLERKALLVDLLAKVKNGTDLWQEGSNISTTAIGNLSGMVSSESSEIFRVGEIAPWKRLFSVFVKEVFSGQIIASSVVVFFVVGFLLREWIVLNPFQAPVVPAPPPEVPEIPNFANMVGDIPVPMNWDDWRSVDEDEDEDEWEEEEEEEDDEEEYDDHPDYGTRPYAHHDSDEEDGEEWGDGFDSGGWNNHIQASTSAAAASTHAQANTNLFGAARRRQFNQQIQEVELVREEKRVRRNGTVRQRRRRSTTSPRAIRNLPTPDNRIQDLAPAPPFRFDFQFEMPPHPNLDLQPQPEPHPNLPPVLPRFQLPAPAPAPLIPPFVAPPVMEFFDQPIVAEDEEELDMFDDFEGVLDAVGMNSFFVLLQNMGLMNLLIGLCLSVALWIPLTVGRLLAVFNAIRIITIPLSAVRSISDPLFDFVFGIIAFVVKTLYTSTVPHLLSLCPANFSTLTFPLDRICQFGSPVEIVQAVVSDTTTSNRGVSTIIKATLLGIAQTWTKMSYEEDVLHRGLCVTLGYVAILVGGIVYLNSTNSEYGEAVNRAIREGIKQQLTLMKVCIFVFIELIIFPFTCGLFLNLATLPVFPDATINSRIAFHCRAPLSALLITWLVGTIFMFCFSIAIDAIRDCARPGSLWFIRDPASADFHPIREILERNSSTQARKIATSAVLYASVIFATFGLSILFLKYACSGILPLRWHYERTLSLPIDLIVFRYVIPFAIKITDPRSILRKVFLDWSKLTAHQLRLTSFIFGGVRDPSEEGSHIRRTLKAKLTLKRADINLAEEDQVEPSNSGNVVTPRDVVFRREPSFARVPAVDGVRVVPGRRMLVRCEEGGQPLDAAGMSIIFAQAQEMRTTRPKDKYEIVYLPPNFKTRLILFVYLLFFSGTLAGMTTVLVPLLVGRYIFSFFTANEVHDIYSFVIGAFLSSGLVLGVRLIASLRTYQPRLHHIKMVFHATTAIVSTMILLPLLSSAFFSLYIMLPLSNLFPQLCPILTSTASHPLMFASPTGQPTFLIIPSWMMGCVLVNVAYHFFCLCTNARNPFRVQLAFFWFTYENVSWSIAAQMLNRHLLFPLLGQMTLLVALPGLAGWCYELWRGAGEEGIASLVDVWRTAYTDAAISGLATALWAGGKISGKKWIRRLREEEYLVEKKLRNYGENEVVQGADEEAVTDEGNLYFDPLPELVDIE